MWSKLKPCTLCTVTAQADTNLGQTLIELMTAKEQALLTGL